MPGVTQVVNQIIINLFKNDFPRAINLSDQGILNKINEDDYMRRAAEILGNNSQLKSYGLDSVGLKKLYVNHKRFQE